MKRFQGIMEIPMNTETCPVIFLKNLKKLKVNDYDHQMHEYMTLFVLERMYTNAPSYLGSYATIYTFILNLILYNGIRYDFKLHLIMKHCRNTSNSALHGSSKQLL